MCGGWRNPPRPRVTTHLRVGAQRSVLAAGEAPASSIELHGVQEGAGRGRPAAL